MNWFEIVNILLDAATDIAIIAILCGFAWLETKIGDNKHLTSINEAKSELKDVAIQTVGELNQRFVEGWKEAGGGKLTDAQAAYLRDELVELAMTKMSKAALELLEAAKVDAVAYLRGAAEDWIYNGAKLTALPLGDVIFGAEAEAKAAE